jgi:hypothetical protein
MGRNVIMANQEREWYQDGVDARSLRSIAKNEAFVKWKNENLDFLVEEYQSYKVDSPYYKKHGTIITWAKWYWENKTDGKQKFDEEYKVVKERNALAKYGDIDEPTNDNNK